VKLKKIMKYYNTSRGWLDWYCLGIVGQPFEILAAATGKALATDIGYNTIQYNTM